MKSPDRKPITTDELLLVIVAVACFATVVVLVVADILKDLG